LTWDKLDGLLLKKYTQIQAKRGLKPEWLCGWSYLPTNQCSLHGQEFIFVLFFQNRWHVPNMYW